jgi:hypothetical protein
VTVNFVAWTVVTERRGNNVNTNTKKTRKGKSREGRGGDGGISELRPCLRYWKKTINYKV